MHLKIKDSKYFENINFKMHKSVKKEKKKKKKVFICHFSSMHVHVLLCTCNTDSLLAQTKAAYSRKQVSDYIRQTRGLTL